MYAIMIEYLIYSIHNQSIQWSISLILRSNKDLVWHLLVISLSSVEFQIALQYFVESYYQYSYTSFPPIVNN